jgi:hypothetical protein
LLGKWQELARRDRAPPRVSPAHECLRARNDAAAETDDRLELEAELSAVDSVLEIDQQFLIVSALSGHGYTIT